MSNSIPFIPGDALNQEVDWFESFFGDNSIKIYQHSKLKKYLDNLRTVGNYANGEGELPHNVDLNQYLQKITVFSFMIRAIHMAHKTNFNSQLVSRLKLFTKSDVVHDDESQQSQPLDMIWELIVGSIISDFCSDIRFEEPDIISTFNNVKWGIACKVIYSKDIAHLRNKIIEGVKQLEKSKANYGCVAININRLVDHSDYLKYNNREEGEISYFPNSDFVIKSLVNSVESVINNLKSNPNFKKRIIYDEKNNSSRDKTRLILLYAQIGTMVNKMPTLVTAPGFYNFRYKPKIYESEFWKKFNEVGKKLQDYTIAD